MKEDEEEDAKEEGTERSRARAREKQRGAVSSGSGGAVVVCVYMYMYESVYVYVCMRAGEKLTSSGRQGLVEAMFLHAFEPLSPAGDDDDVSYIFACWCACA